MSYLEFANFVVVVILPFLLTSEKVRSNSKPLILFLLILLLAHLIFEGMRWQMTPIYITSFICIFLLIKEYSFFKGSWLRKILSGIFLFIMLGLGFSFSNILAVINLPAPSGAYHIGARYIHFISENEEYITDEEGDKRELMIKVWYPAKVLNEKREPYLNEGGRKGFAAKYKLPENTFNYLDKTQTNTFEEPEVAEGMFPILIFSHGYYSNAFGYYALIEEIVSHGFIVFNINHTYESVGSMFPSGEIKLYNKAYERRHNNEEMAGMIWNATQELKKATSKTEKKKAIEYVLKNYYAADISNRWEKDIDEIVNLIPDWNKKSFLANHIDTSKIGLFGHSQGGSLVGQTLFNNPKIAAGINIDGVQWGDMIDTSLNKPFLLISSDWPDEHPNFNEVAFFNGSTADFYVCKIKNSGHSNFMDIPFMIKLPLINEAGDIEPQKAIRITSEIVIRFFNKYLSNEKTELLDLANVHPELAIEKQGYGVSVQ
jgi:predicted esterase